MSTMWDLQSFTSAAPNYRPQPPQLDDSTAELALMSFELNGVTGTADRYIYHLPRLGKQKNGWVFQHLNRQ